MDAKRETLIRETVADSRGENLPWPWWWLGAAEDLLEALDEARRERDEARRDLTASLCIDAIKGGDQQRERAEVAERERDEARRERDEARKRADDSDRAFDSAVDRAHRLEAALREARMLAGDMLGHQHWDNEQTYGANCPICIKQREILDKITALSGDPGTGEEARK